MRQPRRRAALDREVAVCDDRFQLARRHPWSARILTLTRPIPSAVSLTYTEWMLSALRETGADAVTAMQMHVTLYAYAQGLASNLES